jgi:hypothetical protein
MAIPPMKPDTITIAIMFFTLLSLRHSTAECILAQEVCGGRGSKRWREKIEVTRPLEAMKRSMGCLLAPLGVELEEIPGLIRKLELYGRMLREDVRNRSDSYV